MPGEVGLATIMLHDLRDGLDLNHHIKNRKVTRAKADMQGLLDLAANVQAEVGVLNVFQKVLPRTKFVVLVDNHGSEWIANSLQDLKFEEFSPKDHALLLELASKAMTTRNFNAYEYIYQKFGVNTENVLFLNKGEAFRIGVDPYRPNQFSVLNNGIDVGPHGQSGRNGSKSINIMAMYESYANSANGHYHTSGEYAGSARVGSLTHSVQDYHNGGPSSGDASILLVYSDQAKQLLRYENGAFVPNAEAQPEDVAFTPELPRFKTRATTVGGAQNTDQYINPTQPKRSRRNKN